jgi:hypothetical protein
MALTRIAESRNRQHGKDNVIQEFGTVYPVPIGLGENVRSTSIGALNARLFANIDRHQGDVAPTGAVNSHEITAKEPKHGAI